MQSKSDDNVVKKSYSIFEDTMVDMNYLQIEKAVEQKLPILLPVGLIEEHGPHLPLGVDTYEAYIISKHIKDELERKNIRSIIAPPFYWGMNNCTAAFPGSFTVREETMINLLWDIMASLKRWGFENVFVYNHHFDAEQNRVLISALKKARLETGIRAYWVIPHFLAKRFKFSGEEPYLLVYEDVPTIPTGYIETHADSYETSVMLHYFEETVDKEVLKTLKPTEIGEKELMIWRHGWSDARKVTPQGYLGHPNAAQPEKGKEIIEEIGRKGAEVIQSLISGNYRSPKMD